MRPNTALCLVLLAACWFVPARVAVVACTLVGADHPDHPRRVGQRAGVRPGRPARSTPAAPTRAGWRSRRPCACCVLAVSQACLLAGRGHDLDRTVHPAGRRPAGRRGRLGRAARLPVRGPRPLPRQRLDGHRPAHRPLPRPARRGAAARGAGRVRALDRLGVRRGRDHAAPRPAGHLRRHPGGDLHPPALPAGRVVQRRRGSGHPLRSSRSSSSPSPSSWWPSACRAATGGGPTRCSSCRC